MYSDTAILESFRSKVIKQVGKLKLSFHVSDYLTGSNYQIMNLIDLLLYFLHCGRAPIANEYFEMCQFIEKAPSNRLKLLPSVFLCNHDLRSFEIMVFIIFCSQLTLRSYNIQ